MAVTQAKIGYGVQIQYGDNASPETFTQVIEAFGEVRVGDEGELIDVTHMDSPDRTREFIGGLVEGIELTYTCNLIESDPGQQAVRALEKGDKRNWRVIATADSPMPTFTFQAVLRSRSVVYPLGDKRVFEFTLKIAGAITQENV